MSPGWARLVVGGAVGLGVALLAGGLVVGLHPVRYAGRYTLRCGSGFVEDRHTYEQVVAQNPAEPDPMVYVADCRAVRRPWGIAGGAAVETGVVLVGVVVYLRQIGALPPSRRNGPRGATAKPPQPPGGPVGRALERTELRDRLLVPS